MKTTRVIDRTGRKLFNLPAEALIPTGNRLPAIRNHYAMALEHVTDRYTAIMQQNGLDWIAPAGKPTTLLEQSLVIPGHNSDYMMFPAKADPVFVTGQFAIPKHNLNQLKKALAVYNFSAVFVVHEMPKGAWKGDITPYVKSPYPQATVKLSQTLEKISNGLIALAAVPFKAARFAAPAILIAITLPAIIAVGGLDPLIIGAVPIPEVGLWQYYVLTGWRW